MKSMKRRHVLLLALTGTVVAGVPPQGWAQEFPTKAIRIIVPFPAGGSLDGMTRELAERMAPELGQTVMIENKPGASTMIASQYVARAQPDGYTLLMVATSFVTSTHVYAKPLYNLSQFAPVAKVAFDNHAVVVNPDVLPVNSIAELIEYAKKKPGEIAYGSAGVATAPHLEVEEFNKMAGIRMAHIPFNGSAPAVTNLVGGQIGLMFDPISSVKQHIESGRLRALAVTGPERSPALPDVPTVAESGLPGYARGAWDALLAPAGTPPDVVARLNASVRKALQDPELMRRWSQRGLDATPSSPEELQAFLASESENIGGLVKELGIRL